MWLSILHCMASHLSSHWWLYSSCSLLFSIKVPYCNLQVPTQLPLICMSSLCAFLHTDGGWKSREGVLGKEAVLQVLHAHLTAADTCSKLSSFQCLRRGSPYKLPCFIHGCEPKTVLVGKVVAWSSSAIAFDEWSCPEVFQTWARGY